MWKLSKTSIKVLESVSPKFKPISNRALKICPIDFGYPPTGGFRTYEQQAKLYQEGASKCDGVILKSKHQTGEALDFFAFVNGKLSWDKLHLALVAASHLQAASEVGIPLEWGGLWGWDYPHLQLNGGTDAPVFSPTKFSFY